MSDESKTARSAEADAEAAAPAAEPTPDYFGQLLMLKAEFENYRKRVDREKPEWFKTGRAEVLMKLLPLYDLLQHAYAEVKAGHADTPLAKGLDAIFREFDKLFLEEKVTQMDPLGRPFDPHYHEALGFVHKKDVEDGAVADVLQTGYLLDGKVLRTAKVRLQQAQKKTS